MARILIRKEVIFQVPKTAITVAIPKRYNSISSVEVIRTAAVPVLSFINCQNGRIPGRAASAQHADECIRRLNKQRNKVNEFG